MATNAGIEYEKAEKEYLEAKTFSEKMNGLQKMLSALSKHKGNEKLQMGIKQRISKYKELIQKEKKVSKGRSSGVSVKKEGAAQIVIIGKTNSGKSTLLSKLTNAKPLIADYEFTTKKLEMGTLSYKGIVIQMIEVPAITKNFIDKEKGPAYLGIIRNADLIVMMSDGFRDEKFVLEELDVAGIRKKYVLANKKSDIERLKEKIWNGLDLIYVYTKSPGKEKEYPPLALKKNANVKDFALHIHKDFVKKFSFARIWGESAKHQGMKCGLKHTLKNGDVIEIHTK